LFIGKTANTAVKKGGGLVYRHGLLIISVTLKNNLSFSKALRLTIKSQA
jgi:hypothetical protein